MNRLIDTMERRVKAVLDAEGGIQNIKAAANFHSLWWRRALPCANTFGKLEFHWERNET